VTGELAQMSFRAKVVVQHTDTHTRDILLNLDHCCAQ